MSASNEWTEWHLTPRGWERGTEKIDFSGIRKKPTPDDRVLTCQFNEYLSSVFSKMDRTVTELWRSENEELVSALVQRFGECPQSL